MRTSLREKTNKTKNKTTKQNQKPPGGSVLFCFVFGGEGHTFMIVTSRNSIRFL